MDDAGAGEALDDFRLRDDNVSLAALYVYQCRYDDAQKHIQDILEWDRRRIKRPGDSEDIHVARALDLISDDSCEQETQVTVEKAREDYLEAWETFGLDERETMKRRTVLAGRLQDEEMFEKAEEHYLIVLSWHSQTYGMLNSGTLDTYLRLAKVYAAQLRTFETIEICGNVVTEYKERLGELHPKTLFCILELSTWFADAGLYALAIAYSVKCIKGYRVVHGAEHSATRLAAHHLRQFRELLRTKPVFVRILLLQGKLWNSKVAPGRHPDSWPWLADWEPQPLDVPLTAAGDLVPYTVDKVEVDGRIESSWRQLEEADYFPTQTLEEVMPEPLRDSYTV